MIFGAKKLIVLLTYAMLTTAWKYIQLQRKHVILFKFLLSLFFQRILSL